MDAGERELFRQGLAATTGSADVDAALVDLGWRDALDADPRAAVSLLFELQGGDNATSSALDQVILSALDSGMATGVVLPTFGLPTPPGAVVGEAMTVRGVGTIALRPGPAAIVAAAGDGHVLINVEPARLDLRPVTGLDPALGLVEVSARIAGLDMAELAPDRWDTAVAAGQRAIAHELVGAARAMLRLACDHAVDRVQFGRPIASFQAVRHRLADTLVAIEAADAALASAWEDSSPQAAALAKAVAGRAARLAGRHCQQVLAGIGFTTEHPLHRYVKRALVLDQLLGDTRTLTHQLGTAVLTTGRLPALLPL